MTCAGLPATGTKLVVPTSRRSIRKPVSAPEESAQVSCTVAPLAVKASWVGGHTTKRLTAAEADSPPPAAKATTRYSTATSRGGASSTKAVTSAET